jgi:GT2 family glycosyltransferase
VKDFSRSGGTRLTVLLVTWNARSQVEELLRALRHYALHHFRLVVVDNASTDGTRELVREIATEPGVMTVLNETNRRCAAATNQGLALVETEFVAYFCASHALVAGAGWDAALVAFMESHPAVSFAGDVWNPYGFLLPSKRYRGGWTPEVHGRERLLHVQGGAWIARRRVFEELGMFAEDEYPHAGMDVEFSYRLLSHGHVLGRHPAIASPPAPEKPGWRPGVHVYHPPSDALREWVRRDIAALESSRRRIP